MPTGPRMAAVMATKSSRSPPSTASSSAKTCVQVRLDGPTASPVMGSMTPVACIWSAWWFSAGANPLPLRVTAWTITGPPNALARTSADSSVGRSWPSTGPMYFRPRSSNMACGASASLMPRLAACRAA